MTIKEINQAIGQVVGMKVESFIIPVIIKDAKTAYGTVRFLVSPLEGSGEVWCEMSRFSKWSCSPTVPGLTIVK